MLNLLDNCLDFGGSYDCGGWNIISVLDGVRSAFFQIDVYLQYCLKLAICFSMLFKQCSTLNQGNKLALVPILSFFLVNINATLIGRIFHIILFMEKSTWKTEQQYAMIFTSWFFSCSCWKLELENNMLELLMYFNTRLLFPKHVVIFLLYQ